MVVSKLMLIAAGAMITAVGSAIVSIDTMIQNRKLVKKIDKSIHNVEEKTEEQIADSMIEKAIAKTAEKQVGKYMVETEDAVLRTARKDLETQARNAVVSAGNDIREKASEEISRQVAMLDIEQLKKRVCDQAERHVIDKFDGCLDASLKKFQDQLDNTRKIYDGIARAMADKESKKNNGDSICFIWKGDE